MHFLKSAEMKLGVLVEMIDWCWIQMILKGGC